MFLGIEIGGTKLQLGIGAGDGQIVKLWRGTVDPAKGGEGIRQQILASFPELLASAGLNKSDLRGIGVGFGGPTDDASQTVITSHQIVGWDGFPLADWLTDLLDLPTVICNDADVAGLAEALFGAGKGLSPIFYITVGTGIGGGLIIDGEIYRGVGRGAAEIGHMMTVKRDGWTRPFITKLEHVASGTAIGRRAVELLNEFPEASVLAGIPRQEVSGRRVAVAARDGDSFSRSLLLETWDCFAGVIQQVILLLCPQRIVIGGGVSLIGEEYFLEPLRQFVAEGVFPPFAGLTDIVPAALGEEVVVHGALALAKKKLGA